MDTPQMFADERLTGVCVYCGRPPDTRDHVPSLVLLDDPLPADLPVVGACAECNRNFSLDEEYLACLLECVLAGTTGPTALGREKIKRALSRNPGLAVRLSNRMETNEQGNVVWNPETSRVRNIVLKLAQGHAAYECSEPLLGEPASVSFLPLLAMPGNQLRDFETPPIERVFPEIGSRAFLRAVCTDSELFLDNGWQVVQPGRYRYLVSYSGNMTVRLVLSEYLACEVVW